MAKGFAIGGVLLTLASFTVGLPFTRGPPRPIFMIDDAVHPLAAFQRIRGFMDNDAAGGLDRSRPS